MQQNSFKRNMLMLTALTVLFSSCGISLTKTLSGNQSNNYLNGSVEPLKRSEYTLLSSTTGKANASQFYLLFFPIGKSRTNQELESNAYTDAVENCANADAIIMPRTKYKGFSIPLILINYTSRKITVTGRGVKINENTTAGIATE